MGSSYHVLRTSAPAHYVNDSDADAVAAAQAQLRAVLEGQCPEGHGPLRRLETVGWCRGCDGGWFVGMCRGDCEWCAKPCRMAVDSPVVGFRPAPSIPWKLPPSVV